MRIHSRFLAFALIALGMMFSTALTAAPSDRRTLLLRGRITDNEGWPIGGTRVIVEGNRRAAVTCDDGGQFELKIPLGSAAELAREPIAVRVRAEHRGWRLALPAGDGEIGLDLRVVSGSDGVARCEIRSNHPKVSSALARAFTANGDATGLAMVNFLGIRGEEIGSSPKLELPIVERVALAGVSVPSAPPASSAPPPSPRVEERQARSEPKATRPSAPATPVQMKPESPKPKAETPTPSPGRQTVRRTEAPATKSDVPPPGRDADVPREVEKPHNVNGSRDASAMADAGKTRRDLPAPHGGNLARKATTPRPTVTKPPPDPAKIAADDKARDLAEARQRADLEATQMREVAKRRKEEQRESEKLDRLARAAEKERDRRAEKQRRQVARDAEDQLKRDRVAQQTRWEAPRREVHVVAGVRDTTAAPSVAMLQGTVGAPRVLPESAPRPASRQTPPAPAQTGASSDPAPEATLPQRGRSPRIVPVPEGEPRARVRPVLIRTPGVREDEAPPPVDSSRCTCRIQGTIEVRSEQPLPKRAPVAVSLNWYPTLADTVELFMGSPRAFRILHAPCGPQRLRLVSLSGQRFDVISRDAMSGFRCEPGALVQLRVVLEPR